MLHLMGKKSHSVVIHNNMMWIIGFIDSANPTIDVWYSPNGTSWTCATTTAPLDMRANFTCVTYNNKIYLLGGSQYVVSQYVYYNEVWTTTDGANWTKEINHACWARRYDHTSIIFDNKIWLMGGVAQDNSIHTRNDVWYYE